MILKSIGVLVLITLLLGFYINATDSTSTINCLSIKKNVHLQKLN